MARRELAQLAVERADGLPGARVARDQVVPGELVVIVEVLRLPEFEHHEVRDVDEVADRALARRARAARASTPVRGGTATFEKRCATKRRQSRAFERDADVGRAASARGDRDAGLRLADGEIEGRAELAREPEHAHRVGPVRADLDLDDGSIEAVERDDVRPGRDLRFELHDAVFEPLAGQPELGRRAEHPLRFDPAHLARRDRERCAAFADELRADRRDGDRLPAATFVAAVAIVSGLRTAGVDRADAQAIGVRMLLARYDAAGDDAAQHGARLDGFDRKTEQRQAFRRAYRAGRRARGSRAATRAVAS